MLHVSYKILTLTINGILIPKLFRHTVRKNCSSDREKLLKFGAGSQEFAKFLRTKKMHKMKIWRSYYFSSKQISNEFRIEQETYSRYTLPRNLCTIMTFFHNVCRKSYKSPRSCFFYWALMLIFHRWDPNVDKLPSTLYKSINLE